MSLGQDEAVALLPFRILRILLHHMVVKHIENVKAGQRSARMAGTCFVQHSQKIGPQECAVSSRFLNI